MKKLFLVAGCWILVAGSYSQTTSQGLQKAFQKFESDSQMKHAISSLYVIDAATGQVIFDKNSQIGLAGASTQKIITAATAFELLGKDYRYKTEIGYQGKINSGSILGNVYVSGSGDPTLGSWRWPNTGMKEVLSEFAESFKKLGIKDILGKFVYDTSKWETQEIPDGWIWQDVGNYYGAGATRLNWNENQYDLFLKSGKNIGDPVKVVETYPNWNQGVPIFSEVKSAGKGTGDNAYIYLPLNNDKSIVVRGTIPIAEDRFKITGAMIDPSNSFFMNLIK